MGRCSGEKKWGNLCGDSAVRHLMHRAVRQMQVAPSLCIRLPVLDGDEEACVPIGVSSRDDGGDEAILHNVNDGDECIVLGPVFGQR